MKLVHTLISSVMSGISIAIGGIVYLSCDNKYIGAFLFGIGLFIVLNFKCLLYTGKVGYLINSNPSFLIDLLIIWLGNYIGAMITAVTIRQTRLIAICDKAKEIAEVKLNDTLTSILILSVFCGIPDRDA